MAGRNGRSDSRVNAARYRLDRFAEELSEQADEGADASADERADDSSPGRSSDDPSAGTGTGTGSGSGPQEAPVETSMEHRAHYVEQQIRQAMRRGDFDDLPGAGKPLQNLGQSYDPNWWIRQKIERERLTGLGPPALTLRTENAELDDHLDDLATEHAVRELLTDFNRRVVEARRQLQGGPPVVTPTRDIEAEVAGWRERRSARVRAAAEARAAEEAAIAALPWRERRRARRAARRDY